jgi:patatin-like phospholipase/acyl hydrolase
MKTNKNIVDCFDYFSGVSASSIVLAGLLTKHTVKEMIIKFKEIAGKIFYRSYYHIFTSGFGMFDSKYNDCYINNELQLLFAGMKLHEAKKPLSILTYDMDSCKAMCFYSYKMPSKELSYELDGYDMWKIVRGSTAAPTYFNPYKSYGCNMVDGGVVANNMSEMTFIDSINYFGKNEEYLQVSIGTGNYKVKNKEVPSGIWSWSGAIVDTFFSASSSNEMINLDKLSKFENLKSFHRIDIELKQEIPLDCTSSFDIMDTIFEEWLEQNTEYLNGICEDITK